MPLSKAAPAEAPTVEVVQAQTHRIQNSLELQEISNRRQPESRQNELKVEIQAQGGGDCREQRD